ncbi:MAG: hypothetical protein KH828_01845 [Clostridiales bacterium]|nr:hypothetical protein [Clostridiales bacterium]
MKLLQAVSAGELEKIERLYLTAFPKAERKPFALICEKQKEGAADILTVEEDGEFAGLAITIYNEDLVLLDYFAIDETKRSGGRGSAALQLLMKYYEGKRLLIEIESTEVPCDNPEERVRRERFYHRNGMKDLEITVNLFGIVMKLLSCGGPVSYREYIEVYEQAYGTEITGNIDLM